MAFLIFLLIKGMNKLSNFSRKNRAEEIKITTTKKCRFCCSEIDINAVRCPNCTSILEED